MRALMIATIVMGVMIVAGVAVIAVTIVQRLGSSHPGARAPFTARLDEPAGTQMTGIAALQDRLAIGLRGGGPDRVLLIDSRTGARLGTVALPP